MSKGSVVADSKNFYQDLQAFTDFRKVADPELYHPVPDDWVVAVADIRKSTIAVQEGRYKDVNMVGACCITAVLNVIKGCEIPYVFGGDGATLIIPSDFVSAAREALIRTSAMSEEQFKLSLRIGFVPVEEIRRRGADAMVARFELSRGNPLAMFSGGGVELADQLVKEDDGRQGYQVMERAADGPPDLTGISCRWEPLKARNGRMLVLLVRAMAEGDPEQRSRVYRRIMEALQDILGEDARNASPVTDESLSFRWPPKGLAAEARATRGHQSYRRRYFKLLLESAIQWACNLLDLKAGDYRGHAYRQELKENSDFRRFDDMLRLVFDCSPAQVIQIRSMLEKERAEGQICFGTHESDEALMTCLVFSLAASEHVHFIDGADGGFWRAAIEFKRQLAEVSADAQER
ncbi:hypothetical protein DFP90_101620 [Aestuariispira insulae]|uniref:DUF3095 family protein n=2 Tax=Aestuariispira insulae TaxID=1461337 RepID=A0A3D9HWR2_9PROT|nr:hypothetical protein DFP90_101620 [Aestuariispira insulae]